MTADRDRSAHRLKSRTCPYEQPGWVTVLAGGGVLFIDAADGSRATILLLLKIERYVYCAEERNNWSLRLLRALLGSLAIASDTFGTGHLNFCARVTWLRGFGRVKNTRSHNIQSQRVFAGDRKLSVKPPWTVDLENANRVDLTFKTHSIGARLWHFGAGYFVAKQTSWKRNINRGVIKDGAAKNRSSGNGGGVRVAVQKSPRHSPKSGPVLDRLLWSVLKSTFDETTI